MAQYMLTTVDNPYNPFTQFDDWNAFDMLKGYNTLAYMARVIRYSDELSEADQVLAYQQGINEIVDENPLGLYRKVQVPERSS